MHFNMKKYLKNNHNHIAKQKCASNVLPILQVRLDF